MRFGATLAFILAAFVAAGSSSSAAAVAAAGELESTASSGEDQQCNSVESAGNSKNGKALLQSSQQVQSMLANMEFSATSSIKENATESQSLALRQPPNKGQSEVMTVNRVSCGELLFAPQGECPKDCPFFDEEPGKVCRFRCVSKQDCGKMTAKNNIADTEGMYCRPCKVPGCDQCVDGGVDKCAKCATGYIHAKDGHCYSTMWVAWIVIFAIVGLVGIFGVAWYADLRRRPVINAEGLQEGLSYRSRLKLRMPKNFSPPGVLPTGPPEGGRSLWPLSTSLLDVDVAGPGLLLHFLTARHAGKAGAKDGVVPH
jgi:hypothetical protein